MAAKFMMVITQALTFQSEEEMKVGVRKYLQHDPHVNEDMIGHLVNTGKVECLLGAGALLQMKKLGVPAMEVAFGISLTEQLPNDEYREVPLGAPPPAEPVPPLKG